MPRIPRGANAAQKEPTKRQKEVIDLLRAGKTVPDIAEALSLTQNAIWGHISRAREAGHAVPEPRTAPAAAEPAADDGFFDSKPDAEPTVATAESNGGTPASEASIVYAAAFKAVRAAQETEQQSLKAANVELELARDRVSKIEGAIRRQEAKLKSLEASAGAFDEELLGDLIASEAADLSTA